MGGGGTAKEVSRLDAPAAELSPNPVGGGGAVKEVSRLDAPAAAILMFPPPPTRMVGNVPTADERAMFVLLEVVIILCLGVKFLGIAVLIFEVVIDVIRIGDLMGVWVVVVVTGRKILIGVPLGRGMSRGCCWLTSPGALTIIVELAGRKSLMGDGVPGALTVMPGDLS